MTPIENRTYNQQVKESLGGLQMAGQENLVYGVYFFHDFTLKLRKNWTAQFLTNLPKILETMAQHINLAIPRLFICYFMISLVTNIECNGPLTEHPK